MKVTKAQSAANRQALVDAASRLYRERGLEGVGLSDISREAGFTHGGFYGRFGSKQELAAEACTEAFGMALQNLQSRLERDDGALGVLMRAYFNPAHRDTPGRGCPMAALAVDAAREQGLVGQAMSQGVAAYLQQLALHRPDGTRVDEPEPEDKARAIQTLSTMVGGLILARACAEGAPALSDEILATLQDALSAPPAA